MVSLLLIVNLAPTGRLASRRRREDSKRGVDPGGDVVVGALDLQRDRRVVVGRASDDAVHGDAQDLAGGGAVGDDALGEGEIDQGRELGAVLRHDGEAVAEATARELPVADAGLVALQHDGGIFDAQVLVAQHALEQRAHIDACREMADADHVGYAAPRGIGDAEIGELDRQRIAPMDGDRADRNAALQIVARLALQERLEIGDGEPEGKAAAGQDGDAEQAERDEAGADGEFLAGDGHRLSNLRIGGSSGARHGRYGAFGSSMVISALWPRSPRWPPKYM